MDLELKGKVAVITGGSVGIGLAVARGLAAEGVHVALCARDEARVVARAEEIARDYGVRTLGVAADVSRAADVARFAAAVSDTFGGADILINNAGTGSEETIMEAPDEKWHYYLELHLMAAVRLARALVPRMRARGGGVILNNASICATQPLGYEPIYNVSKAALAMFSKCLANELIGDNIRVNTVNPGLIQTPDWEKTARLLTRDQGVSWEAYLEEVAKENTPIGRFASPEELAHFFVFLCSPKASYCVGSSYYVDGGWLKVVN
ncbi:SDR family NAD(P)-dependent oxidoreductase [Truepera radiovictrix]|uniref:Short-chain dehydrogenase/reductase SDR n=1 Tax=Truepera radiovictrix (strain DSM 17093 / CIP 108686 / LMG 22925 / RQ-24) TaxID=649638 RepID=D7CRX5_TRURR|nr:SDR family oxidoreductase [Truepera radiovictrix]ADI15303.1 short-chain dehydrogenase/reductase SDR [Truepera radiovictrix DSM 17093]WMT56146.1 SDR family oxidoreductase [Truepera radiovictrix]